MAAFQKLSTPFFQERVYDIKDVFHRLLWQLRPRRGSATPSGGRLVLVTREASVMELFAVDLDRLAAWWSSTAGRRAMPPSWPAAWASRWSARSPTSPLLAQPGRRLLVDGTTGEVVLDPARRRHGGPRLGDTGRSQELGAQSAVPKPSAGRACRASR